MQNVTVCENTKEIGASSSHASVYPTLHLNICVINFDDYD